MPNNTAGPKLALESYQCPACNARSQSCGQLTQAAYLDRKGVEDYTNKNMSVRTSLVGDIHASLASYNFITEAELAEYAQCTHKIKRCKQIIKHIGHLYSALYRPPV